MLNNENKNSCGFAEEIVSYIYDEIREPALRKFEDHLVDCVSCTDEFAGISMARLSMYEYQNEAFAHLPTPEIVIPYAAKHVEAARAGFFSGLAGLWRSPAWSTGLAFAGVVAICIGLGFGVLNYLGNENQVAAAKTIVVPVTADSRPPKTVTQISTQIADVTQAPVTNASVKTSDDRVTRPVRASVTNVHRVYQKNLTANAEIPENGKVLEPVKQKAPVLSSYEDDDDKSLRLTDLVDDGGV